MLYNERYFTTWQHFFAGFSGLYRSKGRQILMKLNKRMATLSVAAATALVACGGFVYTTVGGTVKGMPASGAVLVLANENNFSNTLRADGEFSFKVASNGSYNITVSQQPTPVNCTVANGSGKMTSDKPLMNIAVTCVPNVPMSGTLSGLDTSKTLTLTVNNVLQTSLAANGAFNFQSYAVNGKEYAVAVAIPPAGQVCKIQNGSGTANIVTTPAIKNVAVNCSTGVPVGGNLTGLKTGTYLIVTNSVNGETRTLTVDGVYAFAFSLAEGDKYDVKVTTQPTAQKCTVANGSGTATLANANGASNIAITCVAG